MQQPSSVVQQPSSVVQQPSSVVQQPTSVVQQSTTSVVQNTPPSSVVQQPKSSTGKKLLQTSAPIEFISNNGSSGTGLSVDSTTEGVPNISFTATTTGQTAEFIGGKSGSCCSFSCLLGCLAPSALRVVNPAYHAICAAALQVAITTTDNGLGTPLVPYQVDAALSPNCGVTVKFVAIAS